jgi:hypothetical protein
MMPYYRRLPSGLWQATVRGRDGKRHSRTDRLKAVKQWAAEQEAAIARGEFRDPRLGEIKVAGWHARVVRARGIEDITKAKNASLWRTHCEPELVGVAGFEPAASSSRTSGAAGRLAVDTASSVCWRSCLLATVRGRCCNSVLYLVPPAYFGPVSRSRTADARDYRPRSG